MMYMAFTAHAEFHERLHLSSHKREDGLLLIAEVHDCVVLLRREQVYDGQLHLVEVLNLVDLYPVIVVIGTLLRGFGFVLPVSVIGVEQQVLEVEHVVLTFVLFKHTCIVHLQRQVSYALCYVLAYKRRIGIVDI